jgi:hypothetical protein
MFDGFKISILFCHQVAHTETSIFFMYHSRKYPRLLQQLYIALFRIREMAFSIRGNGRFSS